MRSSEQQTFPRAVAGGIPKGSRPATAAARNKLRRARAKRERTEKMEVRDRDQWHCRFPLCGCKRAGFRLEVSHDRHKGMGGDPKGTRSTAAGMILLCAPRHQTSILSRHAGTIQTMHLTRRKNNGPVAWFVDLPTMLILCPTIITIGNRHGQWIEIAREAAVQQLEPLEAWQRTALEMLAKEMQG